MTFDSAEHALKLNIIKCAFTEMIGTNLVQENQDSRIISVNMPRHEFSKLTIKESHFIRNSKVKVLTVNVLSGTSALVTLHGLVITNNTATSTLVEINGNTISFNVILSVLLVNYGLAVA